eukprot:scaffold20867_cov80-Skeletonema_marinoi.AAC.1
MVLLREYLELDNGLVGEAWSRALGVVLMAVSTSKLVDMVILSELVELDDGRWLILMLFDSAIEPRRNGSVIGIV